MYVIHFVLDFQVILSIDQYIVQPLSYVPKLILLTINGLLINKKIIESKISVPMGPFIVFLIKCKSLISLFCIYFFKEIMFFV